MSPLPYSMLSSCPSFVSLPSETWPAHVVQQSAHDMAFPVQRDSEHVRRSSVLPIAAVYSAFATNSSSLLPKQCTTTRSRLCEGHCQIHASRCTSLTGKNSFRAHPLAIQEQRTVDSEGVWGGTHIQRKETAPCRAQGNTSRKHIVVLIVSGCFCIS